MASNEDPKTVLLSGNPVQYEAETGDAVTPGIIIEYNSDEEIVPAAAESFRIVRERGSIGESIDTEIPEGDHAPFYVCGSGDRCYAFLADGEDVSYGDELEANSDGVLAELDSGVGIAYALEDINNTSGERARIRVEVK